MEKIIILGNSGHAQSLIDALERQERYEIVGCVVNDDNQNKTEYPIIGKDRDLKHIYDKGIRNAAIGIGYLGKSNLREKLYDEIKKIGFQVPVICDPSAIISEKTVIGEGTFVGKGAVINAYSNIGNMCIINTGVIVEHGCEIGDFSHISVGAVLCGGVQVGKSAFVGANATVIQKMSIPDNCIVGAGMTIR